MKLKKNQFSIIIPAQAPSAFSQESLAACVRLYPDQEIIFCPDLAAKVPFKGVKVVPSGPAGPSVKRDLCTNLAQGDILAFLDDDAYPLPGWLEAAAEAFEDPGVAAVGGPAMTPPDDSLRRWASGLVYSSFLVGGPYAFRYVPRPRRDVDDYPTCNLLVRREVMKAIGGFNTGFWPGEDTVACLKITHELRRKITYDPAVMVYHHRRDLFEGHLKQVKSYALHRGYFVKRFPQTSLRLSYFLPSLLLLGLVLGWLPALAVGGWFQWWASGAGVFLGLAALEGLRSVPAAPLKMRGAALAALVAAGVVATHLVYGLYFMQGLVASSLPEESQSKGENRV